MTETSQPALVAGSPSACLEPRFRKQRFNPPEASEYLSEAHSVTVAKKTLDKLRSIGGGPAFQRFNRNIFYPRDALDTWAIQKLGARLTSTSIEQEEEQPND